MSKRLSLYSDTKAVLFDLDGTLTDYSSSAEAGLRAAWEVMNNHFPVTYDRFKTEYWRVLGAEMPVTSIKGIRLAAFENRKKRFREMMTHLQITFKEDLLNLMATAYGMGRVSGAKLVSGARETLQLLKNHFSLGLITEGSHETQMNQLTQHGIESLFKSIVISGDTPYHKPDLELYKIAVQQLDQNAKEIMMVGDRMDWDLKPAKQLGMVTILVDYENAENDLPNFVDDKINEMTQLLPLLLGHGLNECR